MRKALLATALLAVACVVTVVAQQRDTTREAARGTGDEPPAGATQRRPSGEPGGAPMEIGSRLEYFLMRPGRTVIRDTWRVGRIDCKPWGENAPGSEGVLRVNAVIGYLPDRPEQRIAGVELLLQDEVTDRTFLFDTEQLGDLLVALETLRTTSEGLRDPPRDVSRRAVFNLNGFEIGMAPRRSGGYVAPLGPDEQSVGLNPDNFQEFTRLLTEAQTILKRETEQK